MIIEHKDRLTSAEYSLWAHFTSAGLSPNPNRNPNPNLNPLMLKPCRVDYARHASLEFLAVIRQ
ncbi:MAG: hypothetical protein V2A34_12480, partial [Lentisphaerota bacterium]